MLTSWFCRVLRKPTWGTCAGLILLAESANRTKKGGQELIGGLDVRVNRNHFGRQVESFQAPLELPFLESEAGFPGVFIRAPVVEKILPSVEGVQVEEQRREDTVVAPTMAVAAVARASIGSEVEVMATLPGRAARLATRDFQDEETGDIIAVRQDNVFGTSFHPELTSDARIHTWWLQQVEEAVLKRRQCESST
jgi:pyridoxal 5'-phosphate synthase pdxT subunit